MRATELSMKPSASGTASSSASAAALRSGSARLGSRPSTGLRSDSRERRSSAAKPRRLSRGARKSCDTM